MKNDRASRITRRASLFGPALALAAGALPPASAQARAKPIQLHVDLEVDPAKEKQMLANYGKLFRPAIRKQPGFVEVKLLKLRQAMMGNPGGFNYRLLISFQTEEQRKAWVANDEHQRVWPTIEQCLKGAKYQPWLYDVA
ncbi:MAG: hypothetical protein R2762_18780 [Bryobacteraceae bacterium]